MCLFFMIGIACANQEQPVYQVGDVVRLKAGGPNMSVYRNVYRNYRVPVNWIDYTGRPVESSFTQEEVEKVD